jgi:hypothetical protein
MGSAYVYGNNNPLVFVDPSGMRGQATGAPAVNAVSPCGGAKASAGSYLVLAPDGWCKNVTNGYSLVYDKAQGYGQVPDRYCGSETKCVVKPTVGEALRAGVTAANNTVNPVQVAMNSGRACGHGIRDGKALQTALGCGGIFLNAYGTAKIAGGGRSGPSEPTEYSTAPMDAGYLGETHPVTGNITVSESLSGEQLAETIRHEAVHQRIVRGPISGPVSRFLYNRSALWTFGEEAMAEAAATGSVRAGLGFPIANGYITAGMVGFDGVVAGGAGAGGYGVYRATR